MRTRLPNCRSHQGGAVDHNGFRLVVGISRFDDGRLAEIFIDERAFGTILRDSAMLVSPAMQAGIDATAIRAALSRTRPLAAALDHLGDESS
jgi:ribonucleoside-diphosphate reductase alpha chain